MGERRAAARLRAVRHPVRAAALAVAALAVTSALTSGVGVAAAMAGAVLGLLSGELLGRSRFRLSVVVGAHLGVMLLVGGLSWAMTRFSLLPEAVGPATVLVVDVVLRYLGGALCLVSGAAVDRGSAPLAMAVELVAMAAALSVMFAAHRDAVIERPLWLSDLAWRHGWDPTTLLLGIGGGAVVVLAALLLTESRRRISAATVLLLPLLALLATTMLGVADLRQPETDRDLGLTEEVEGDEPNPTPPGYAEGGDQPRLDGGGSRDRQGDGGQEPQREDQGDGGSRDRQGDGGQSQGGRDSDVQPQHTEDGGGGQGEEGQGGQCSDQREREQQLEQRQQSPDRQRTEDGPSSSPAPMAVVLLEDDYSPEAQAYYFRQTVWSEFNGSRLVEANRPGVDQDVLRHFPTRRERVRQPPPEAGRRLVHGRVALLADHPRPFALESPLVYEPASNPNPARFERAYRFESLAQTEPYGDMMGRVVGDPEWPDDLRQHYLEHPDDPRYEELAREIVAELPAGVRQDRFAQALAVKLYLDRELTYSTRERHRGASDPAADMLFGNRIGYCVHFAHAAVYLWRSLGIPSRVSTGYHVPEDNRRGSVMVIRASDGHAWPELWIEGMGWVVLDIAAARNLDPPAQPLDEDLQEMLGDMARENPPEPLEPEPEEPLWPTMWRDLAGAGLALLLAALVALYLVKLWRWLIPRFASGRHVPRVAYRAALDRLVEVGLAREHGETRERYAERLQQQVPVLRQMTEWHVAARLSDPQVPAEDRDELRRNLWREAMFAFSTQLRSQVRWYRRLGGALNPISFFFTR